MHQISIGNKPAELTKFERLEVQINIALHSTNIEKAKLSVGMLQQSKKQINGATGKRRMLFENNMLAER